MAKATRISRGTRRIARQLAPAQGEVGLTLIELIVAFSLMLILSVMALPVARVRIQREKERRLRVALQEVRVAIDRHKDMADEGKLGGLDPDNYGYPESLEVLVEGVPIGPQTGGMLAAPGGVGTRGPGGAGSVSTGLGASGSGRNTRNPFGSRSGRREDAGFGGVNDPFARVEDAEPPESIRFLRSIPVDPMTGQREWGKLSMSDDPLSRSWSGRNIFDIYSLSSGIALDGTRYSEW